MTKKILLLSLLALLSGCGGGGGGNRFGEIISTSRLYGTGFTNDNRPLSVGGEIDGNWSLIRDGQLIGRPVLLTPEGPNWWGFWLPNSLTSQWIGASNTENAGLAPYSFEINFFIDTFDPEATELIGRWAVDDDGSISVNGVVIESLNQAELDDSPNWNRLNEFRIEAGSGILRSGQNRISITITETDNFLAGARFEGELNIRERR